MVGYTPEGMQLAQETLVWCVRLYYSDFTLCQSGFHLIKFLICAGKYELQELLPGS